MSIARCRNAIVTGIPATENLAAQNSAAKPDFEPLGHLLGRSPLGGWFEVECGISQHYKHPPSPEELREERQWLQKQREEAAKAAGERA
jgi:hypothetical protein